MQSQELLLIRHAPVATGGILCGRTDVAARLDGARIARLRSMLPDVGRVVTSPALRCRQTAAALWPGPGQDPAQDARLWEQDFGAQEGMALTDLPDLGERTRAELAAYRPPGGESFDDLCARVAPALRLYAAEAVRTGKGLALVVHAGVIRAALGLVLGTPSAGLGFEVGTLSVTGLRCGPDGPVAVTGVNQR